MCSIGHVGFHERSYNIPHPLDRIRRQVLAAILSYSFGPQQMYKHDFNDV